MKRDLSSLHLLFRDKMEQYDVTIDQLAEQSGYAKSTIYEYTGGSKQGKYIMWPILLTALFELTGDSELLLTGNRDIIFHEEIAENAEISELRVLVESTQSQARLVQSIAEIFSDGVIDKDDAENIERFNRASQDAIATILATREAINKKFMEAMESVEM